MLPHSRVLCHLSPVPQHTDRLHCCSALGSPSLQLSPHLLFLVNTWDFFMPGAHHCGRLCPGLKKLFSVCQCWCSEKPQYTRNFTVLWRVNFLPPTFFFGWAALLSCTPHPQPQPRARGVTTVKTEAARTAEGP